MLLYLILAEDLAFTTVLRLFHVWWGFPDLISPSRGCAVQHSDKNYDLSQQTFSPNQALPLTSFVIFSKLSNVTMPRFPPVRQSDRDTSQYWCMDQIILCMKNKSTDLTQNRISKY